MSSIHIFLKRLILSWKSQIGIIRTIIDWTVLVYIVVPTTAIFLFIYRNWWLGDLPIFIQSLPLNLFFLFGTFFCWYGMYRTYIEEADKVFFIKKQASFLGMKKWGFYYSLFIQFIRTLFYIILLLPFLILHYQVATGHIIIYFLFLFMLKQFIVYISLILKRIEHRLVRACITSLFFIVVGVFTQIIYQMWINNHLFMIVMISLLIGFIGVARYLRFMFRTFSFEAQLSIEKEESHRLIDMIYTMSYDIEKPRSHSKKKPWIFKNSKIIFKNMSPKNGFVEAFLKVFLRNSQFCLTYLQIISVAIAALVIVPPLWIKLIIFAAFLFMLYIWLDGAWARIMLTNPITKKYELHSSFYDAKRKAILLLYFIGIIWLCIVVVVGLYLYKLL